VECIKKLVQSLRRNAREERVLFHFNGLGVPRPTDAGEIWVKSVFPDYYPIPLFRYSTRI
jgi:regulator-associated protein of mTOR